VGDAFGLRANGSNHAPCDYRRGVAIAVDEVVFALRRDDADVALGLKGKPLEGSLGEVVLGHLDELVRELLRRDRDARKDERDGVHKMRVATRRLRSALATYRPVLATNRTEFVRDELKWLGRELGSPRDAEVLRDQLDAAVRSLPQDLRMGTVIHLLEGELVTRHQEAHAQLMAVLDSPRYWDLLEALDALVDDPPFNDHASRPAAPEADRLVRKTVRRVRKMAIRAEVSPEGIEREQALHDVRKAAKRSRYAAESAALALGARSTKLARRMKRLQDLLGEVQDSVGSRRLMHEIGMVAHLLHDNAFAFGLLYGREEERARIALAGYEDALRKALRPS
jgi:CHAD domain-containing protein